MSEPAKVIPFTPVSEDVENPIEHVAQTAANAIDDLNAAIWTAKHQRELVLLKELTLALIEKLEAAWSTAHTLDTHFQEMRNR